MSETQLSRLERLLGVVDTDEDGYLMQRAYRRWSPLLLKHRVSHRLFGLRRGCSCSRCFHHPRRRIPPREIYDDRVRLAKLEREVRGLRRQLPSPSAERL